MRAGRRIVGRGRARSSRRVADRDSLKDAGESIDTLRLKAQGLNIFVPQTLESLKKVCAEAQLFIGNDSGPMHLAAALGTPCLGLFGPNLPSHSGPWPLLEDGPHQTIEGHTPCRPCEQIVCHQPHDWCMDKIQVDDVLTRILSMMKEKA